MSKFGNFVMEKQAEKKPLPSDLKKPLPMITITTREYCLRSVVLSILNERGFCDIVTDDNVYFVKRVEGGGYMIDSEYVVNLDSVIDRIVVTRNMMLV
jgi:hypothetical protein